MKLILIPLKNNLTNTEKLYLQTFEIEKGGQLHEAAAKQVWICQGKYFESKEVHLLAQRKRR
jgi:hypothetical protein